MHWKKKKFNINNRFSYGLAIMSILLLLVNCNQSDKNEKTSRVASLPYFKDATFTPYWLQPNTQETKDFHTVPDFDLVNQLGDTITQKTFQNKIYVTDFFFTTCPGICPKMTDNMSILQEEFKDDPTVLLLSHSVMPEYDSVSILQEYASNKGISSYKWHLVTGDREQIYDLGRNHYFVEEDLGVEKNEDDFLHTENFLLIDKSKHIRGIYNGLNKTSITQLVADIETLKLE